MANTVRDAGSMIFFPTAICGCFRIESAVHPDERGVFVKTFNASAFAKHGIESPFTECFYSRSKHNVLRGMHVQLPPGDHGKLVYCMAGSVMDVTLDLRRGSPSFGVHAVHELSADSHISVWVPRGVAHGFYVTTEPAITVYHVTSEHRPDLDAGIAWNSFGMVWPTVSPVLSQRDAQLPTLAEFDNPFEYTHA